MEQDEVKQRLAVRHKGHTAGQILMVGWRSFNNNSLLNEFELFLDNVQDM